MRIRIAAVAAAITMASSAGAAQRTLDECKATEDKLERLRCYDELHERVPAPDAPQPKDTASGQIHVQPPAASVSQFARLSLDARWDLDAAHHQLFVPDTYRPMYVLLANWTNRTDPQPSSPAPGHTVDSPFILRPVEAKYQISFKSKFAQFATGTSVWGAYTQSSRWQVYNPADSRPFRETNYEPEVIVVQPLRIPLGDGSLRMATLAFNHQSNGRALPLSRSWNRVIASVVYENGPWTAELRPWWRIPESTGSDDNPDIGDFAGRGELRVTRRFNEHFVSLQLRHSLRFGARSHGSAQLDWVFPIPGLKSLHGQLQLFNGYAESMIDYNVRQTRIGFGFTIAGWQ